MIEIPNASVWLTATLFVGLAPRSGQAQDCAAAGAAVQIQAKASGTDTITVRYTVFNHARDTVRWIRIGAGIEEERTVAVNEQTPVVTEAPPGWRGRVVYPEETAYVHLWWEAVDSGQGLEPGRSLRSLAVRAPGPNAVRPGQIGPYGPVQPIDFTRLPFKAGGSGGTCWWGRVTPMPSEPSDVRGLTRR